MKHARTLLATMATLFATGLAHADLTIGVSCGPKCGAAVPIAPAKLRVGAWRTIGIPGTP